MNESIYMSYKTHKKQQQEETAREEKHLSSESRSPIKHFMYINRREIPFY